MKTTLLKVSRIGNSRGIRLPATMLRKYRITESVLVEEQADQIILRAVRTGTAKLTWEQTYQEMAACGED
jgi:antitoxin MazE